ncbi:Cyanovirin-N [Echria macrotheca]|uniref:Cyanovirin-N n=1 Tax=Echria macrotheca TaxID=438768 RepID=A0AAJ0F3E6_9PEZI|nr:Cyanovirin-N [Echria macrotheca]
MVYFHSVKVGLFMAWLAAFLCVCLAAPLDQDNLSETCSDIHLSGFSLEATCCGGSSNQEFKNELDLNLCIGIDYNKDALQWGIYGKLSLYCTNCTLEKTPEPGNFLECACRSLGNTVSSVSTLRLDDGIKNINGSLTCMGGGAVVHPLK